MIEFLVVVNKRDLWMRTQQQLRFQANVKSFRILEGAQSIADGYNRLAKESSADILCFCHQDAELLFDVSVTIPGYVERLPQAGVFGFCGCDHLAPNTMWWVNAPRRGRMTWNGNDMNFGPLDSAVNDLRYHPVDAVDGYCIFIRHEVFDKVGGFDESIGGWHCYDLDLCIKCLKAGYQNYVIGQPSKHMGTSAEGSWLESLGRLAQKHGAFLAGKR